MIAENNGFKIISEPKFDADEVGFFPGGTVAELIGVVTDSELVINEYTCSSHPGFLTTFSNHRARERKR